MCEFSLWQTFLAKTKTKGMEQEWHLTSITLLVFGAEVELGRDGFSVFEEALYKPGCKGWYFLLLVGFHPGSSLSLALTE